jgi:hypothetical protein
MATLKTTRAGAAALSPPEEVNETQMLIGDEDLAGKFQMSRPIKFNYEKNRMAYWMNVMWEGLWMVYELFLLISAVLGLTYVSPAVVWPFSTWTWLLTGATGYMFLWFTATVICALRNKLAVDRGAKELPCMELRYTISYSFFLLGGWAVALGFMADLYANRVVPDTAAQSISFTTKMWIVVLVASLNLLDPLRHILGVARDYMLIKCKSTCYDL